MLKKFEKNLLLVVLFFLGLGLVQVYSSSYIFAAKVYGEGLYFFKKQCLFTFIGFSSLMFFTFIPWRWVKEKAVYWFGILTVFTLFLSLFPLTSVKVGGARRWIELPFIDLRFEPGELLKITLPLILAHLISKYFQFRKNEVSFSSHLSQSFSNSFKTPSTSINKSKKKLFDFPFNFLDITLIFSIFSFFLFLLFQPDFGTFTLCVLTLFVLLFVFGLHWSKVLTLILISLPVFYFLVLSSSYRYNRVLSFLDPWGDPSKKGFQVIQSLVTVHSGGLFGKGLGQGQGKLFFLPEAHTDFTLAVLSEELGFIGFLIVFALYIYMFSLGFKMTLQSKDTFSKVFTFGFTFMLALGVTIHMGVVFGLLPTKGLALPFLSYGGSSLVTTCTGMGLLLNASRTYSVKEKRVFFDI